MNNTPSVSRPAPPFVPPVEFKGIRYEQEMQSYNYGGDQPGGYLVAKQADTGKRLWMIKVYELERQGDPDLDGIGLYFSGMRLVPEKGALVIENEAGARYLVDLESQKVTVLFEPEGKRGTSAGATPPPPPKKR